MQLFGGLSAGVLHSGQMSAAHQSRAAPIVGSCYCCEPCLSLHTSKQGYIKQVLNRTLWLKTCIMQSYVQPNKMFTRHTSQGKRCTCCCGSPLNSTLLQKKSSCSLQRCNLRFNNTFSGLWWQGLQINQSIQHNTLDHVHVCMITWKPVWPAQSPLV